MSTFQWLEFAASYAVQVALVIATAATLDCWCTSSDIKSRVWNACFLSILGLIFSGLLLPRLHLFHPWSKLHPTSLLAVAQVQSVLGTTIVAIWILGSAVMVSRWITRLVMMHRLLRKSVRLSASQHHVLAQCASASELTISDRRVEFRICPESFGPFCYQMHRPFVFLPGSLFAGKAEHLSHVLCHELTHLRTQHPMQLFCQKFAQCLLWFHPLMWISSNRASLVREFVCDDASVKHLGSTTAYLRALIATAEETQKHQEETLAISRRNDDLMERVRRLAQLNEHPTHCHRVPVISVFMICTLACSQVWLPLDPLASDRSIWSPWPTWSADVLHEVNVSVRDYEIFQHGHQLHEWIEITNKSREPVRSW